MGWLNYPPECREVESFPASAADYHTCVAIKEVTAGDFKMGITMLGSISTVVILFYLVNYPDVDMRKYTYSILSETASIFCAVLIYSSVNQIVEEYVLIGKSTTEIVVCRIFLFLVFYIVMTFTLLKVSGLIFTSPEKQKMIGEDHDLRLVTQNNLAECVILAHITGFAGIGLWTTIQTKIHPFPSSPFFSFLVFPINIAVTALCIISTSLIRHRLIKRWKKNSSKESAEHKAMEELGDLWKESMEDAEHDTCGIFSSFLLVQSLRFAIGGHLPGEDGVEGPNLFEHTARQAGMLYAVAGCFFLALLGFVVAKEKQDLKKQESQNPSSEPLLQVSNQQQQQQQPPQAKRLVPGPTAAGPPRMAKVLPSRQPILNTRPAAAGAAGAARPTAPVARALVPAVPQPQVAPLERQHTLSPFTELPLLGRRTFMSKERFKNDVVKHRGLAVVKACVSMSFAWASFYGTQWLVASWRVSGRDMTVVGILTAIVLSYVVFILIRILDKAADGHLLGNIGERAVRRVISAFGVLIGFGWEKSFDMSVDAVASYSASCDMVPALPAKIGLGVLALCLIMPAWRMYIIPMETEHGYRFGFVARKLVHRVEDMLDREEEGGTSRLVEYEKVLRKLAGVKGGKYFRLLVTAEQRITTKECVEGEEDEELMS